MPVVMKIKGIREKHVLRQATKDGLILEKITSKLSVPWKFRTRFTLARGVRE